MAKSLGQEMLGRLTQFAEDLKKGATISERYTCRRVTLDLVPTKYSPEDVKNSRRLLGASQAMFAKFLGVKTKTVQAWERGATPSDMASRFMDEIRRDPRYWLERFKGCLLPKTR